MSTYAIIKTGGKQVKVEVGQAVYVEKLTLKLVKKLHLTKLFLLVVKTLLSELHLFQELLLLELLKNKENKRKLLLTSTNLKKVATVNKVTVNLTLKLSSTQSTLNF